LSIEPLAENAIKHGIDRYSKESKIILSSYEGKEEYYIEIKDNGAGFDMNDETLGKGGIGLHNAISRLKLMCDRYMTIERINGWTVVKIMIPKKYGRNYDANNYN